MSNTPPHDENGIIPLTNVEMVNNSSDRYPGQYILKYTITPDKSYSDLYVLALVYSENGTRIGFGDMDLKNINGATDVTNHTIQIYWNLTGDETEVGRDLENDGWYYGKLYNQSGYPVPAYAEVMVYNNSTGQYKQAWDSDNMSSIQPISNSTISLSL